MASPEGFYRGSVRVFSLLFVVLGAAILTATLLSGGGIASRGVPLGVAFLAVGILRSRFSS